MDKDKFYLDFRHVFSVDPLGILVGSIEIIGFDSLESEKVIGNIYYTLMKDHSYENNKDLLMKMDLFEGDISSAVETLLSLKEEHLGTFMYIKSFCLSDEYTFEDNHYKDISKEIEFVKRLYNVDYLTLHEQEQYKKIYDSFNATYIKNNNETVVVLKDK